jgi:2-iminobutanoate/2-iminopropanoate deaminase
MYYYPCCEVSKPTHKEQQIIPAYQIPCSFILIQDVVNQYHPEQTDKDFVIGAFSDAVAIDGWLYISGQGPVDFATGTFIKGTIEEETRQTLHNISCLLKAAGCTMEDVVKCSAHLVDIADWERFNKEYLEHFKNSEFKPQHTYCGCLGKLAMMFYKIKIRR